MVEESGESSVSSKSVSEAGECCESSEPGESSVSSKSVSESGECCESSKSGDSSESGECCDSSESGECCESSEGQMQPQLGIWKRFIRSLLRVNRCSPSWASGRGLLEVYWGWTGAASAGDQEEVYQKFIKGGQILPQLVIWKRFIRSL